MGHVTLTKPFSGTVCRQWARTSYDKLCTKFEISTFTHYEDMTGDKNTEIWGVIGNIVIRYSTYDFLFDFNRNCVYLVPFSSYSVLFIESGQF